MNLSVVPLNGVPSGHRQLIYNVQTLKNNGYIYISCNVAYCNNCLSKIVPDSPLIYTENFICPSCNWENKPIIDFPVEVIDIENTLFVYLKDDDENFIDSESLSKEIIKTLRETRDGFSESKINKDNIVSIIDYSAHKLSNAGYSPNQIFNGFKKYYKFSL